MTHREADPDLPRAFLQGRPGARDALLDAWIPQVLAWAARLGGPDIFPEDIAQDVFIVVLDRIDTLQDFDRFPGWLFGITRRVVARHRRRVWRRRWVPGVFVDQASDRPDPHAQVEQAETGRQVQGVLERIPAAQREVLVLCDLEERSATEAAELLGLPVGTVKSRLRLGRQRFRALARSTDLRPLVPCEEGA